MYRHTIYSHTTVENIKKVQKQKAELESYQAARNLHILAFKNSWMHFLGMISI